MHICWRQTCLPLLVPCLHWDICARLPWRLLMTTQCRSGHHGAVTIPGLGADSGLWDSTGWADRRHVNRHGITSSETLPRNFCYWKEVGAESPFGLVLNIFGYLLPSRWDTGYQHVKYIHRELWSHQDFMYIPFFHLEIFPEQKKMCVWCVSAVNGLAQCTDPNVLGTC